jgi:hypothetical protein
VSSSEYFNGFGSDVKLFVEYSCISVSGFLFLWVKLTSILRVFLGSSGYG